MEFENPEIEEGINTTNEHPLKEFVQLVFGVIALLVALIVILNYSALYLVKHIPFSFEQEMVEDLELLKVEPSETQAALQQLADELVVDMDLPAEVTITVHYSDEPLVNAFATLGGHVFFYRGLLEKLDSENALSMVMAHEIAHIKYRHPISALGKGLTLLTAGAVITGASGSSAGETLIGSSVNLGLLKFSRDQEAQSDLLAAQTIHKRYGNILGAQELFKLFEKLHQASFEPPEFFSSHPHSDVRWKTLESHAKQALWEIDGIAEPMLTLPDKSTQDSHKSGKLNE